MRLCKFRKSKNKVGQLDMYRKRRSRSVKSRSEAILAANGVAAGTFMHWPGKWIWRARLDLRWNKLLAT